MTTAAGQAAQQLRQDIQHELTTANQLTRLISNELQLIKNFTSPGGEFEENIKKNAELVSTLANACHINIKNIQPLIRTTKLTNEEHNTSRDGSDMNDTQ